MKRFFNYMLTAVAACLAVASCMTDDGADIERDETLLYGKWLLTSENGQTPIIQGNGLEKQEYWRYNAGGTGSTWDESDDITEAEGQAFTWTLTLSELEQIHLTEMAPNPDGTRASIPRVYIITELTATTLSYEDAFDTYTFTKQ